MGFLSLIQSGLFFALGFLVAGFLALMIAPAIWRRAVYLTRKRIESAIPLTANELQADKDKLRAEHAMALRREEISVAKLRAKSTLDAQSIVKQSEEIKQLKAELASQTDVNVQLDQSLASMNEQLSSGGLEIQDLKLQLSTTSAELAARTGQLESLTSIYQEAEKRIADTDRKVGEFETDVEKLANTVADLRAKRRKDQEKVRDMRAETRSVAALLKNEKVRAAENEKKYERVVAEKSDIEVKLSRTEKTIARRKEEALGLEADIQELEQRLADSQQEYKSLEKELADMTLRYNRVTKAIDSDAPEKAIASLQADYGKLERELKASIEDREKLIQKNAELKSAAEATPKSSAKNGAVGASGDAALREELAQLAAEVVQMTALVEGEDSRINALIDNAADGVGESISLAARVKALKEMADKSAD